MFSAVPLEPVLLQDPVTMVNTVHSYGVVQSGKDISWKVFSTTNIATSSIGFTCPPLSANIIVDRSIRATMPIRLTMSGLIYTTNSGYTPPTSLVNSSLDAPRFMPISSMTETLNVRINSNSLTIPMSDVIHPLMRFSVDSKLKSREYSTTPCMFDASFNYQDLVGTARNPLAPYGNTSEMECVPRGGFPFRVVSNPAVTPSVGGTPATAVVDFFVTENLYLSPLYWGCSCNNLQGLYNVTELDVTFNFLGSAGFRAWSHANIVSTSGAIQVTSIINSAAVQFNNFSNPPFSYSNSTPQLLFKYYTPNILTPQNIGPNIPITYPYFNIVRYVTGFPPIAYGNPPTSIQSNSIQLNGVPRRLYIFARPENQVLQSRCDITDTYLTITSLMVTLANQNTLMSQATQVQLYDVCVKNHTSQDWPSFSGLGLNNSAFPPNGFASQFGGVGSVICLEYGTDLQLPENSAPGVSGQYLIQVTATVQNSNSSGAWDNLNMSLYLINVFEGTFTVTGTGSASNQQSVLSVEDVLNATSGGPGINYRQVQRLNGGCDGGDFLSSIRDLASTLNNKLRETKLVSRVASAIPHPIAQVIAKGAEALGYSANGGVAIQGGRKLTKAELRKRL